MSKVYDPKLKCIIGDRVDGELKVYEKYKGRTSFCAQEPVKEPTEKDTLKAKCDELGIKYKTRASIADLKNLLNEVG